MRAADVEDEVKWRSIIRVANSKRLGRRRTRRKRLFD